MKKDEDLMNEFKKQKEEAEEWLNSHEGIYDSLKRFGDEVPGDYYDALVCKVLHQLPKSVRSKVLKEVYFIIVGEKLLGHPFAMKLLPSEKKITLYFIILNFGAMVKFTEKERMFNIAHEIAHHILDHYRSGGYEAEKEADALAEKWGFKKPENWKIS